MATISTSNYNDSATRSAGEAMTVDSGAIWTVRTDLRHHANAPASNTGSLASYTITEGEIVWDSRNIRWMPYNSGTGNVPAIGTTISQGGVSGYLLGVWSAINVMPTAAASAMPVSGFIKFREHRKNFTILCDGDAICFFSFRCFVPLFGGKIFLHRF